MGKLRITDEKGFQLKFKNGLTISVVFGQGNYCSNKLKENAKVGDVTCDNAEVAIWNDKDWLTRKFIKGLNDDVAGYIEPDEIASLIRRVQMRKI